MDEARVITPAEFRQQMAAVGNVIGAVRMAQMEGLENPLDALRPSLGYRNGRNPAGFTPAANATLFEEDWEEIDDAVLPAAQERLVIVDDLQSNPSLVHSLEDWSVLESTYEAESDVSGASQSLSGAAEGEEDLPDRVRRTIPVPITFKPFRLEARMAQSSMRRGESLDTTAARAASRSVSEKLEDMVFNGADRNIVLSGNDVPGLTTFGARETYSITTAWDAVTSNTTILDDVRSMVQLAFNNNYFGPFNLYVPGNWATVMGDDYNASSGDGRTVMQRIEELPWINRVRVADRLADSNVVLVQMTPEVIDLAVGQAIDTIQWEIKGGMVVMFKVFAAIVHRLKSDHAGNTGIVHGS